MIINSKYYIIVINYEFINKSLKCGLKYNSSKQNKNQVDII